MAKRRFLCSSIAALGSVSVTAHEAAAQSNQCTGLLQVIEQSTKAFASLQGAWNEELGGFDGMIRLDDAQYCLIIEGPASAAYRCVWPYPLGQPQAQAMFQELLDQARTCIGGIADERVDQPVNHPDYYASHRFEAPDATLHVSLKNKAALNTTFVSIRVNQ